MNPYKEDGLRARLSFDPAYCKRCTGPSSVNDGYITGPGPRYGHRACRTNGRGARQPARAACPAPRPVTRLATTRGPAGQHYRDD